MLPRAAKNLILRGISALCGDVHGHVRLPVLRGPARGLWLSLDLGKGEAGYALGTHERDVTRRMAEMCRSGWVVWDCGTHVGYDLLVFAKAVGANGQVVGFEPDPTTFARAVENIRLNGITHASLQPFAIGAPVGSVEFVSSGNQTSHLSGTYIGAAPSAATAEAVDPRAIQVECISLDQALNEKRLPVPNLIKMDLEGAERDALRHMADLATRIRPVLIVELHNVEAGQALLAFSRTHNYELSELCTGRQLVAPPLAPHVLCLPMPAAQNAGSNSRC